MSFVIDPPLLVGSGAAIGRYVDDSRLSRGLQLATLATFVGVSAALYANHPATDPLRRPFGARSGREFMLTSGLARVNERAMSRGQHALALSQFALYPAWLALGVRLGRARR